MRQVVCAVKTLCPRPRDVPSVCLVLTTKQHSFSGTFHDVICILWNRKEWQRMWVAARCGAYRLRPNNRWSNLKGSTLTTFATKPGA